jgi:adenylate cyclase
MSGNPENEFFRDGVTEDILTHLSRVKGLRVTSRTSVMQYKGTTNTMREIARELGVDSVLEGSIRVAGGKVRVTVQLIDAAADDHLWADSYDESLEDVFAIQRRRRTETTSRSGRPMTLRHTGSPSRGVSSGLRETSPD